MNKFEKIYKKVLDADKKFKEQGIPINLDFKIEDFRDALIECNDKIFQLKELIGFLFERVKEQDNARQWHKVEVLMGKLVGELPNRNAVWGDRNFLVHFQIVQSGQVHDGVMESDYDDEEGFFELEDNMIPVHWCVAPMPPLSNKIIKSIENEIGE